MRVEADEQYDIDVAKVIQILTPFIDATMQINEDKLRPHVTKLIKKGRTQQKELKLLNDIQQQNIEKRKRDGNFSHV